MKQVSLNTHIIVDIYTDCILIKKEDTSNAVIVDGITRRFLFHPDRLAPTKKEIAALLDELPDKFKKNGGGGSSFQNVCFNKEGKQWTSSETIQEMLIALGLAINKVERLQKPTSTKNPHLDRHYFVIT